MNGRSITTPHSQRGVVLLIALIILVAMTLAGIGMMRSVDTGSVIAGNMVYRKATLLASDAGTSAAFNALVSVANSSTAADKGILQFDGNNGHGNCDPTAVPLVCQCPTGTSAAAANCQAANVSRSINFPGYYSTPVSPCEVTGQVTGNNINGSPCTATQNRWWLTAPGEWANAVTLPPVTDPTNGAIIATVSYLIHRMCQLPNAPPADTPTLVPPPPALPLIGTQLCQSEPDNCGRAACGTRFFYRITTRSVGLRNTVSYTQTLVKLDMQ